MPTNPDPFGATVEEGILAVKEWQNGSVARLDRFIRRSLIRKGQSEIQEIRRDSSDEHIREVVTRAVRAAQSADQ
jgi:hypothetical protein